MKKVWINIVIAFSIMLLVACGENQGSTVLKTNPQTTIEDKSDTTLEVLKTDTTPITEIGVGYYVDSSIFGVSFSCGKQSGTTDRDGKFTFEVGKGCSFSINSILLKKVKADELFDGITVLEENLTVAQFLQSLDDDANATNGIEITIKTKDVLKKKNIKKLHKNKNELKSIIKIITDNNSEYKGRFITLIEVEIHIKKTKVKLEEKKKKPKPNGKKDKEEKEKKR